jgi:hypothetical protein
MPSLVQNGKHIYSVDMMLSYVNTFHHPIVSVNVNDFESVLTLKAWGDGDLSILDVINQPSKYKEHLDRITSAQIKYPIIIYKNEIIDGMHRLANAYLNKKRTLKAYIFDKSLMDKFMVQKGNSWQKAYLIHEHEILTMYLQRFGGGKR